MKTIISAIITCFLVLNMSAEKRTFLGAETVKSSKEIQAQLGLNNDSGHTIKKIIPESPAEKSGLKINDVVFSIDGKIIKNHIKLNEFIWAAYSKEDEIKIDFYREGKKSSVKTILDSKVFNAEKPETSTASNQQKAMQDIMKQLQNGGLQNLIKGGGANIATMIVDGEHKIAVSGKGKNKHVKVTNSNSNEVEFDGDIIDGDFSDVPTDLRPKVERAVNMLGGLNLGGLSGKDTPKAKDDSAEKVDDFIKEIEKKKSSEENKEDK